MGQFLEHRPTAAIRAYFASKGLPLTVHVSPPEGPSTEEPKLPTVPERTAAERAPITYWAALGRVARHYGTGQTADEAIRSAARRYRIEQAPDDAGPD